MVQDPTPFVPQQDWKLPDGQQDASNLAMIVGLGGAVANTTITVLGLFQIANGDAGIGWTLLACSNLAFVGAMGVLWVASLSE